MSGDSLAAGSFGVADNVVFALMLAVSTAIGVYHAWASRSHETSKDFLTASGTLTALPVSMSLTASFMSSIMMLSYPSEVYRYGAVFVFSCFSFVLAMLVVNEVFLPVFYRLAITSSYEYLELRFNRATRLLGTVLFSFNTILYTGIVIYGPALALSQVTHMDLSSGIILTGVVCTLYCTMGGLKAVVWTDVFQIGVMGAGYLSLIVKCVSLQGGVLPIISDSQEGGRLNIWDFDINPLRRQTFWTVVIGGTFNWISVYGTNQAQIQRYVSCKSITQARLALNINLFGLVAIQMLSVFAGMCIFSIYKNCDPWTAGLVSDPDQLMMHLATDTLTDHRGLSGLFFAAVCSASLSTVSSSINALAAVTLEDLIKPYTNMSEKHLSWMSKGLSLLFGILCMVMAGLTSAMGGMMQACVVVNGAIGGPLLGLFTLGILCPFVNSKGALSGIVSGLAVSFTVSLGSLIYPPPPAMARPLPLTTDGCNFTTTDSLIWTSTAVPTQPSFTHTFSVQNSDGEDLLGENWPSLSFFYFGVIGAVTTVSVGVIVSLLTGGLRTKVELKLMLMKEDMTSYHLFAFIKDRVVRRAGKFDPTKGREKKGDNPKSVFCDTEIDLTSSTAS